MYDRAFNLLAVLTLLGVGFIVTATPYLFDTAEAQAEPPRANVSITRAYKTLSAFEVEFDPTPALETKANKETAKARLDEAQAIYDLIDSVEPVYVKLIYKGEFFTTSYYASVEQCGNTLGITASGKKVTTDPTCHTVAVDPSVIPLGTKLVIEGYTDPLIIFEATDTGGDIKNYWIDIYAESEQASFEYDPCYLDVWIVED